MTLLHRLYAATPPKMQHVLTSLEGYRKNRKRYGRAYARHREWLTAFDTKSAAEKREFQQNTLTAYVEWAVNASPYYRRLHDAGKYPVPTTIDELDTVIPLEKEDLRAHLEDIATIPERRAVLSHTGGTTGKSLIVRFQPSDLMQRMALLDHFKSRHGFEHRKMRRASFGGKHLVPSGHQEPPYWRYNHACRQMLYSTFHISEQTSGAYIDSLNAFRPAALDGFPSAIFDLAQYVLNNKVTLDFKPLAVFTTSETVTHHIRQTIEAAFGCPVVDQYASAEGAPFITQCTHGTLHVEQSSGVFEVDDNGDALVTSFMTSGTPLIRYRIGDRIRLGEPDGCPCGLTGQLVDAIEGRSNDYLVRADGAHVNSANIGNLFKYMPNAVVDAQLVQERLGEITARIVVDPERYRPEHDETIAREFALKFDTDTSLQIIHVPSIPRETSGKRRLVKNLLP